MEHIHTAKLFTNGNSQAVRLPKEFRFDAEEVLIYREGGRVILQSKNPDWDSFFLSGQRPSEDFMRDRRDKPPQKREIF